MRVASNDVEERKKAANEDQNATDAREPQKQSSAQHLEQTSVIYTHVQSDPLCSFILDDKLIERLLLS